MVFMFRAKFEPEFLNSHFLIQCCRVLLSLILYPLLDEFGQQRLPFCFRAFSSAVSKAECGARAMCDRIMYLRQNERRRNRNRSSFSVTTS